MFAVSTYDEIIKQESQIEEKQIVVFIFVRPTMSQARDFVRDFEYIHYNSGEYCSIYAIGYTNDASKANDRTYELIERFGYSEWFFSTKAFVEFKNNLEQRINWDYTGEVELLILQNDWNSKDHLNFQNYVAISIDEGLRKGYIDSFPRFMESLVRSARKYVSAEDAIADVASQRISIRNIIQESIDECKKIPKPIKSIMKDKLFYRSANSYRK